jgi:hypothetical protein
MMDYEQKQGKFDGCMMQIKYIVLEIYLSSMSIVLGVVRSLVPVFPTSYGTHSQNGKRALRKGFPVPLLRHVRT